MVNKWGSFSNDSQQNKSDGSADISSSGSSLFLSGSTPPVAFKQQFVQPLDAKDAAVTAGQAIQQNFNTCGRLPKMPTFKIDGAEVGVEESVMGAMGSAAAKLLDLNHAPTMTAAPGLGSSSSGYDED